MKTDRPMRVVYPGGLSPREQAIVQAHRWQRAHAEENDPVPTEPYLVIRDLLLALPEHVVRDAIKKGEA